MEAIEEDDEVKIIRLALFGALAQLYEVLDTLVVLFIVIYYRRITSHHPTWWFIPGA